MNRAEALEILGIDSPEHDSEAFKKQVKKAYKSAAAKAHPDRDGGSTEKMQQVNQAKEALLDPKPEYTRRPNKRGWDVYEDFTESYMQRGDDVHKIVWLSLKEVCEGCKKTIKVHDSEYEIDISPGVMDGTQSHLRGLGYPAKGPKGTNGDCIVTIRVEMPKDLNILPNGEVWTEVELTLTEAIYGCNKEVQGISSKYNLSIPKEIQDGFTMRMANKGMPVRNIWNGKYNRNHHFVKCRVKIPTIKEFEEMIKERA